MLTSAYAPPDSYLTTRDRELLLLLASDLLIDEIARKLNQSPNSVATRAARLRDKFGVKTNHGLIAEGFKRGIL